MTEVWESSWWFTSTSATEPPSDSCEWAGGREVEWVSEWRGELVSGK